MEYDTCCKRAVNVIKITGESLIQGMLHLGDSFRFIPVWKELS